MDYIFIGFDCFGHCTAARAAGKNQPSIAVCSLAGGAGETFDAGFHRGQQLQYCELFAEKSDISDLRYFLFPDVKMSKMTFCAINGM